MPIDDAICAIIAIWFIIISCSISGFVIAFISIGPIPFIGYPPSGIIMSGEVFVMLSIRAWMSSLA